MASHLSTKRKAEVTQYSDYDTGKMTGVQFPVGTIMGFFLLTTASNPPPGPTESPVQ